MKNLHKILFLSFLFITNLIFSQDIIELNNGDDIKAKVIEISNTEIKYKKFSNIEGPIYTINKSKIVMIKYENGEKDVFGKGNLQTNNDNGKLNIEFGGWKNRYYDGNSIIDKHKFEDFLKTNAQAFNMYEQGKHLKTIGLVITIPSSFIFGYQLGAVILNDDTIKPNETALILSGIGVVGALIIDYSGRSKQKKAIGLYNKSDVSKTSFIINKYGIGFSYSF